MARNRIDDQQFAGIAKVLKEVYNFDIDSMRDGLLKSEDGAPVYKLAFKTAVLDLFKKVAKDGLVFASRNGAISARDIVVRGTYWCMLNIGTPVSQKGKKNDTIHISGIRKCRIGAISRDKEILIVFPMMHIVGENKTLESKVMLNPQIIQIDQVIFDARERHNDENLMDYFNGVEQKAGTVVSYKARDFCKTVLTKDNVSDKGVKPTLEGWKYSIENEDRLNEFPLMEQFIMFMNSRIDVAEELKSRMPQEVLREFEDEEPTIYNYLISRNQITKYMSNGTALFDNLYYIFAEKVAEIRSEKHNWADDVFFTKETYAQIFKFIDEYYEATEIFFTSNSHGIATNNTMNLTLRDIDIMVGGVYENVNTGIAVNSLSRVSGMQKVVVIGIDSNTQNIFCYPMEGDRILSYKPLVLKPINFMTDNLEQTSYFDINDEVSYMIDALFSEEMGRNEVEEVANFPIFKGKIDNRWDKKYSSKYIEFLFKQFDPDICISKVYPKVDASGQFSYYCSNVDNDERSDPYRFVAFPDKGGARSVRIGGEFSNIITYGHYKNLLYHGLCDVGEVVKYIFNNACYKATNHAGYIADIMEALDIRSRDGQDLLPLIQKIVDSNKKKSGVDKNLLKQLIDEVVYTGGSQSVSGESMSIEEIMRTL